MTNSEDQFSAVASAVMITLVIATAYHRVRARKAQTRYRSGAREPSESEVNEGSLRWLRPLGLVVWVVVGVYVADPGSMPWARIDLPMSLRWTGVCLALASVPLILWTLITLDVNLSSGVAPKAHHVLVTGGPYKHVRHPWYGVLVLLLAGLALTCANWILAAMVFVRAFYYIRRSTIEDQALAERYGEKYRSYASAVPAFVPRL